MKLSVLFVFEKRISSHVRKSKVSFGLSATAVLFLSCSFGLFCIVFVWLILAYQLILYRVRLAYFGLSATSQQYFSLRKDQPPT
jgi:hypothetical protein